MAIIISKNGKDARKLDKSRFEKEEHLQEYIYDNPDSIPLYDIKENIKLLILAREFSTESGPIDAVGIDKDGEIYLVETKLYKNPDKRLVVAQVLDYGASLWRAGLDSDEFIGKLNQEVHKKFGIDLSRRLESFFQISEETATVVLDNVREYFEEGKFKFVVLMDKLHDRLKDLIVYINENSKFDVYAVELEYYKYDNYEIVIPKIFGAEVKKDVNIRPPGRVWDWVSFKERLEEFGNEEVTAAQKILEWAEQNNIKIDWSTSQRGSFILSFNTKTGKGFYPFAITGDAMVSWNAPHAGNKSPYPFDNIEKRAEILKRLQTINGAIVDLDNVDGYSGLKLPLHALANEDARREFLSVCSWIKDAASAEE